MKKLQNEFVRTPVNCLWENRVTWSEFLVFVTAISISSWKEAFHVNTGKKMIDVIKYDSVFFIIRCFQLIDIPYFLLDISYLETYVHFSNLDSIFSFRSDGPFTRCMICNTMSVVSLTSACGCYVRVLIPVKYILYYSYLKYSCPTKCD